MANSRSSVPSAQPDPLGSETPRVFTPPLRPLTPRTSAGFAFVEFAVSHYRVDSISLLIKLAHHRHTDRCGNALSERTGRHINTRNMRHAGMTLQHSTAAAKSGDLTAVDKSAKG